MCFWYTEKVGTERLGAIRCARLSEKALTLQGIFDEHLDARLQQDARIKAW